MPDPRLTRPSNLRELLGFLAAHPHLHFSHRGECVRPCPCGRVVFLESGGGTLWFRGRGHTFSVMLGAYRIGRTWHEAGLTLDARGFTLGWAEEWMRFEYREK